VKVPPEILSVALPPPLSPKNNPVLFIIPDPLTLTVPVCPEPLVI